MTREQRAHLIRARFAARTKSSSLPTKLRYRYEIRPAKYSVRFQHGPALADPVHVGWVEEADPVARPNLRTKRLKTPSPLTKMAAVLTDVRQLEAIYLDRIALPGVSTSTPLKR